MTCPHGESGATTGSPDQTEVGYRRFRCRACQRGFHKRTKSPFNPLHDPTDLVNLVVLWRFRYTLSLRDLAAMVLQRGMVLTHEAVRDWETKLAPWPSGTLREKRIGLMHGGFIPAPSRPLLASSCLCSVISSLLS
jgi:putative transposase